LEVLVVIALIGLLSGVLIMGTTRLLRDRPVTAEEIFWKIAGTTRRTALLGNRDVRLSFDAKNRVFVAGDDAQAQRFPFAPQNEVAFDFLAPKSAPGSTSAMLVGGQLVETQTLPFVTFYGDGTCSPFRVQLKGKDTQRILEIDPWTCAPVLEAKTDS
jgi:general secretion pathway protein H